MAAITTATARHIRHAPPTRDSRCTGFIPAHNPYQQDYCASHGLTHGLTHGTFRRNRDARSEEAI